MTDDNVIKLPVEPQSRRITALELAAVGDVPDEWVWELCPYTRASSDCKRCPRWHHREGHGECMWGCFGLAEEAIRTVLVLQQRSER